MSQDLIASTSRSVIVGLGVTGLSCARFLYRRGDAFSVVDTRETPPGLEDMQREMPDVPVYAGDIPAAVLEAASELIVSPGVSLEDDLVLRARESGAELLGDIDLFVREAAAPVVGITGSNAKSTVTELLGQMARAAGTNVSVGGNLGVPALDLLADGVELYVLELSSFQLERTGNLNLACATVLNVSEDHMDRHGTMARYHGAKHRIFRGCQRAVMNRDDALSKPLLAESVAVIAWRMGEPDLQEFGLRSEGGREYLARGFELLLPIEEICLPGRHNVANALAALALGASVGLDMQAMLGTLRSFAGLPHRCEVVGEIAGVRYVNDSKGTNIGATEAALRGLAEGRNIVLIAGGQGKGADFSTLRPAVECSCKAVVLIGEDAPLIEQAFAGAMPVSVAATMEEAVARAASLAETGDSVLLSPACASFDMFSGYLERGEAFRAAVGNLEGADHG